VTRMMLSEAQVERAPLTYILTGAVALLLAVVAYMAWGMYALGAPPSPRILLELYLGSLFAAPLGLAGIVAC
jgi:hypothetical protein